MKLIYEKIVSLIVSLLDALSSPFRAAKPDKLLFAAFIVATLRQMGVNGHFIGYNPDTWAWFQPLEVWSGIAMAALEGIAAAYISRRWNRLEPKDWLGWARWSILLGGMITMVVSVVFYVSLYAFAAQRDMFVWEVFTPAWNMVWNVTVAGANLLIAVMIGMVEDDKVPGDGDVTSEEEEAWLKLLDFKKRAPKSEMITPRELAKLAGVGEASASKAIHEAIQLGLIKSEGNGRL